jgi:hypothetical protein
MIFQNRKRRLNLNENKRPTLYMDSYCGEYENKGYGVIKVVKEGDKLYAIFPAFRFFFNYIQYDYFVLNYRRISAANESWILILALD